MTNVVRVWNIGRVFYDKSNKVQTYLAKVHNFDDPKLTIEEYENLPPDIQRKRVKNTLLLMEHYHVYTTGLRDCLSEEKQLELERLGAQYRKVNRGGLATYHGPGQLTAYPVLNLRHFNSSVKWYVDSLEETAIQLSDMYGIHAERSADTGVWVGDNKICAIGVHISRGITTHGVGFNCSTDLEWFKHIVPCGIEGKGVTTLSKEIGIRLAVPRVLHRFKRCFERVFECTLVNISEEEKNEILENIDR